MPLLSRVLRKPLTATALAAALVGCGGATHSASTTTTRVPAPTSSTTAAGLSPAEQARINRAIENYNHATATAANRIETSSAATDVAAILTIVAGQHVGTDLSSRLTAASLAWLTLSNAILHGTSADMRAAGSQVQAADAPLK